MSDEMEIIDFIPPSVWMEHIIPDLDSESSYNLGLVSKVFQSIFVDFYQTGDSSYKLGLVTLKFCQNYVRRQMINQPAKIYFQAPMSYGKTITGLSVPFSNWRPGADREGHIWIAILPKNAIDVWLKEAIKIFGKKIYQSKSTDSPILMPTMPVHRRHIPNYNSKNHLVICSTGSKIFGQIIPDGYYLDNGKLRYNCNFIFDECHKMPEFLTNFARGGDSVLLISASGAPKSLIEVNSPRKTPLFRTIVVPEQCVKYKVPKARFHYVDTSKIPDAKDNFDLIKDILEEHFDNTITVWIEGNRVDALADIIKERYGRNKPIFKYKSSIVRIKDMESSGNGILVIGQAFSEAININCEVMIIIRSDIGINKERRNQLIGRGIRTTNPVKFVEIYHLVYNKEGYLKCRYSDAFFSLNLRMNQDPVNIDFLKSRFQILTLADPSLQKITDADIVAIVGNGVQMCTDLKKMLDWWKSQKSAFTDKMKHKLLYFEDAIFS